MMLKRNPFTVTMRDDQAMIAMDCGGLIRARTMPVAVLQVIGEICGRMQNEAIARAREDAELLASLPSGERCARLATCEMPCCRMELVAWREDETPVFCISLYDEGDYKAPVLILVEEQIDEFISEIDKLFAPKAA